MKYYVLVCYTLLMYWVYLVAENLKVAEFARAQFLSDMWLARNKYYYIVFVIVLIIILVVKSIINKDYYRVPLLSISVVLGDYSDVLRTRWFVLAIIVATIGYDIYRLYKQKRTTK